MSLCFCLLRVENDTTPHPPLLKLLRKYNIRCLNILISSGVVFRSTVAVSIAVGNVYSAFSSLGVRYHTNDATVFSPFGLKMLRMIATHCE